jgi:chitin synthase
VYSSHKPASTILTGFPQHQGMYRPPQSPSPYNMLNRQSTFSRYTDHPMEHNRLMSMGGVSDQYHNGSPRHQSNDSLNAPGGMRSPPLYQDRSRSPLGQPYGAYSRPGSTNNLAGFQTQGPTHENITLAIRECLAEVDMNTVTKKQVKALVEQKLQCQLQGDKRAYMDEQIDVELANMPT